MGRIIFPEEMFPLEGFCGIHDDPHVRVMMIESGSEQMAVAALELVNVPAREIDFTRELISTEMGIVREKVWVHMTHAITTPHEPGRGRGPQAQAMAEEEIRIKSGLFFRAVEDAVTEAVRMLKGSFGEAVLGWETGTCEINTSRDVETPFGWWIGKKGEGPSNHKMTVLGVKGPDGTAKGYFVSYGCKPCAVDNAGQSAGVRLVSSDVCGKGCAEAEKALHAPVLFCMSAAGDQIPVKTAYGDVVDENGMPKKTEESVETGFSYVEELGNIMADCIVKTARKIECSGAAQAAGWKYISFPWEKRKSGTKKPQKTMENEADGENAEVTAEVFRLGGAAFVAVRPEMNAQTGIELERRSPYEHTVLMSMVNGEMKYMPDEWSYAHATWEAQSSMLMPGAAEKLVEEAVTAMEQMRSDRKEHIKIGTGKAQIRLTKECFPTDQFVGVHDPLYARALVIETREDKKSRRYGILSLDLTSMFPKDVAAYKQMLNETAEIAPQDSWITVTHNFTSPHLWEVPKPGEPDVPRPGHPARTPEEIERCARTNMAFYSAAKEAAAKAAASLQEAYCGSGEGVCMVNASRNMLTKDGWWLGCDDEEYSDHTVPVLKFESPDGTPLALLFAYDCQSSVMGKSELSSGGKLITSDLLGNAAAYVEKEYGSGFTAIALCGAAGDQEPRLKAKRTETDLDGNLRSIDLKEAGFALLEASGSRLGAEILKVSGRITCREWKFKKDSHVFACGTKFQERELSKLHPVPFYDYAPDGGRKDVEVQAMAFGDFAVLGTRAELASVTGHAIRSRSPYSHTAVATMVDGGAKYMVDCGGYDRFTYGAMNSSFVRGSAETLLEEALGLLERVMEE